MNEHIQGIISDLKIDTPNFECPYIGQTEAELISSLKIVKDLNPSVILEIGSAGGGFICLLSLLLGNSGRTFITIDPWSEGTKYEKQYDKYLETVNKLEKIYPKNKYFHIRGKSDDQGVVKKLKDFLGDEKIDFLFIDGGHTYKIVLNDWLNYSVFLSNKSVVGFHDIIAYEGVNKAWKEICSENYDYSFLEFKEKGVPLLKDLINDGIEKFKKTITLGVGYLFKK